MTAPTTDRVGDSGTHRRELLPTATAADVRADLLTRIRARPARPVAALALIVIGVVGGLVIPRALGRVVDLVASGGHTTSAVTAPVIIVAAACLVQAVFSGWGDALVARCGEEMLADIRESALGRALAVPLERLERSSMGDLVSRVSSDTALLAEAVRSLVPQLVGAVLEIGLTMVALLLLDWRFALAALLAVPLQVWAVRWLMRTSRPVRRAERIAQGELAQTVLESVDGAHTVRAFRLVPGRLAAAAHSSRVTRDLALRSTRIGTRFFGRLNVAEWTGLSALLVVGYVLVRTDHVGIGTASAAALYFHRLFDPVNGLLSSFDEVQSAGAAATRVLGLAQLTEPLTGEADTTRTTGATVELRGVGHSYVSGHRVLHGADVRLAAGERVAVVGTTGAGKSTLARLAAGVHRPTEGRVLLGGVPLDAMSAPLLRRTVALVNQETHVFAGSLADDLRLARPDADESELLTALETVDARDWAQALPQGLATRIGQGGLRLTPVQAQQLALARLVLADPPIAVLDEATAEAGSAGSRVLEAAAERALEGRTALVVAHRLTQAVRADRVLVLADGRIVEHGTHGELVAAGGGYAALWAAWSGARGQGAVPDPA
ncbi:ABC transporter ATP-binding protein [Streptomyces sp. NBC_01089]|uniref:ABC transporter ATP-binding protein n=1 Tax=Streptomyces sp. NBC_01089 TaxID=2903747 RepID=UPI0038690F95|nr:ABC transporter ATP-binding protein/permease [Streptomyces sp. NBC_01089]